MIWEPAEFVRLPKMADWLLHRRARSSLIVVAPHGGRRRRKVRRGDAVNDLYTAELAGELAERLDAVALINRGLDRNQTDLNRIDELIAEAPELPALLCREIDGAPGGRATVFFIHGWNMVVPCCDIGVGVRRRGDCLYGRYPTVSRSFYDTAVAALEKEFLRRGLRTTVGLRYPGNGPNNALQLFSGRYLTHEDAMVRRLSEAAVSGRVDAVQLELGISLRWPGSRRQAALDSIVAASRVIDAGLPVPKAPEAVRTSVCIGRHGRDWKLPSARRARSSTASSEPGFALQSVIEAADLGLLCGVEATGPRSMAARLCLVAGDGRMFLFVGEGEWDGEPGRYRDHGLDWRSTTEHSWTVSYSGAMVAYPTHGAYEDLEAGLAEASLVEADIELETGIDEKLAAPFRTLKYRLVVDGASCSGATTAVCERGSRRDSAEVVERARVCLLSGPDRGNVTRSVAFDDAGRGELSIEPKTGERRRGRIIARVPVWRVLPDGRVTRFTFGVARFAGKDTGSTQSAVYDRLEVFAGDDDAPA